MTQNTHETKPIYSSLGGDPDLGEIVDMFVEEMPDRVGAIQTQLEEADWDALRRAAHQLKGAAGSYGFDLISPCAGRLEAAVREQEPEEQIRRAAQELVDMCRRARSGTPS